MLDTLRRAWLVIGCNSLFFLIHIFLFLRIFIFPRNYTKTCSLIFLLFLFNFLLIFLNDEGFWGFYSDRAGLDSANIRSKMMHWIFLFFLMSLNDGGWIIGQYVPWLQWTIYCFKIQCRTFFFCFSQHLIKLLQLFTDKR